MDIDKVFTYPRPDQFTKYGKIREAARVFARVVLDNTPECADQSAALMSIREAVMTANAAVALDGEV